VFFRHVRGLINPWSQADILDVGSGTGYYVGLWKKLGVRSVTATDFTAFAIEKLRHKFPDSECHQFDIGSDSLPQAFQNKKYDIISGFNVLFHIFDDHRYYQAFENIFQLLRPGGFLIFSENFIHGDTIRGKTIINRPLNEIETVLKKIGFKIWLKLGKNIG